MANPIGNALANRAVGIVRREVDAREGILSSLRHRKLNPLRVDELFVSAPNKGAELSGKKSAEDLVAFWGTGRRKSATIFDGPVDVKESLTGFYSNLKKQIVQITEQDTPKSYM